MEVIKFKGEDEYALGKLSVTIGVFDGLHRAHQFLIEKTRADALKYQAKSAAFTFDPHPDYVLGKRKNEGSLTPLPEKLAFFKQLGLDYVVIIPFDEHLASLTPEAFRASILGRFVIASIVVGADYRYGERGKGDAKSLAAVAPTTIVPLIVYGKEKMGSELVRSALLKGDVETARSIMGRPYEVEGVVEEGSHIGRLIGFPTANIALSDAFQPLAEGVYIVRVRTAEGIYEGVANIGHNPTLNYVPFARLEVYLLEYRGDLYGKRLAVEFLKYLRPERTFANREALLSQIKQDAEKALDYFGGQS